MRVLVLSTPVIPKPGPPVHDPSKGVASACPRDSRAFGYESLSNLSTLTAPVTACLQQPTHIRFTLSHSSPPPTPTPTTLTGTRRPGKTPSCRTYSTRPAPSSERPAPGVGACPPPTSQEGSTHPRAGAPRCRLPRVPLMGGRPPPPPLPPPPPSRPAMPRALSASVVVSPFGEESLLLAFEGSDHSSPRTRSTHRPRGTATPSTPPRATSATTPSFLNRRRRFQRGNACVR